MLEHGHTGTSARCLPTELSRRVDTEVPLENTQAGRGVIPTSEALSIAGKSEKKAIKRINHCLRLPRNH